MPYAALGRAIAAFVTPIIMVPLSHFGVEATNTVGEAIEIIIVGAITAIATFTAVYMVPDKK